MKRVILTCPFTGVDFEALETADNDLIVTNPATGETFNVTYNAHCKRYQLERRQLRKQDLVSATEAGEILGVSRQRISQLVSKDIIPHRTVNGAHMFKRSDVEHYAETRKVGAPFKEER